MSADAEGAIGQQGARAPLRRRARAEWRRHLAVGVMAMATAVASQLPLTGSAATATGVWKPAAPIPAGRSGQTATELPSGKVLVVGGFGATSGTPPLPVATAELYDPVAGTWSLTASMHMSRAHHTATLLPDGTVLVAGGVTTTSGGSWVSTRTAERYRPSTGTWSRDAPMSIPRDSHTATRLLDGRVLVVGGENEAALRSGFSLAGAEIYDPSSSTWAATGSLAYGRMGFNATLLATGNVLAEGGYKGNRFDPPSPANLAPPELYDPRMGTWGSAAADPVHRLWASAVLLPSGLVLVTGGFPSNVAGGQTPPERSAELYNPAGVDPTSGLPGQWSLTGPMVAGRALHTATVMSGGRVLVSGGVDTSDTAIASAEIWDPLAGQWSPVGPMRVAREDQTATLLAAPCGTRCGEVLVVGGGGGLISGHPPTRSVQLFAPAPAAAT